MDPIWDYINDGTLPDDSKEAAKIRVRSSRFLQARVLHTFLKMHRRRRHRVCAKRSTRGHMRESYRSSNVSRKSLEARILLANNTQRCDRPSQEMQNLSGARQDITPPVRALNMNHQPLAFPAVGFGHIGISAHWQRPVQIHNRRSRLLHQMGRGRALSHNYKTEDTQLCVANHHMQVRYSKSLGIRQWKAIRQR